MRNQKNAGWTQDDSIGRHGRKARQDDTGQNVDSGIVLSMGQQSAPSVEHTKLARSVPSAPRLPSASDLPSLPSCPSCFCVRRTSGRQAQCSDDSTVEFLQDVVVRYVPWRVGLLPKVYKGREADRVRLPHPLALRGVQVGLARR